MKTKRFKRNPYRCRDHKGQVFDSQSDMARHYGISPKKYFERKKAGYSVEACLTGVGVRSTKKTCVDHRGNRFVSESEMVRFYGIGIGTYRDRIRRGHSLEEALTMSVKKFKHATPAPITDHRGNEFTSVAEMCRRYGVNRGTYRRRIQCGYTVEEALTTPKQKARYTPAQECCDHHGNCFPSVKAMCRHYGIGRATYMARIQRGFSVEEALTTPRYETAQV